MCVILIQLRYFCWGFFPIFSTVLVYLRWDTTHKKQHVKYMKIKLWRSEQVLLPPVPGFSLCHLKWLFMSKRAVGLTTKHHSCSFCTRLHLSLSLNHCHGHNSHSFIICFGYGFPGVEKDTRLYLGYSACSGFPLNKQHTSQRPAPQDCPSVNYQKTFFCSKEKQLWKEMKENKAT